MEPFEGVYQIVSPDTTIRMTEELPASMTGFYPTNEEMAEMSVKTLPERR
ncbi:MAG: hypothetical protein MI684_04120 [Chlorobiales bacterium]|nr:hypothetical protein [Chlorobiales bacterium]